MNSLLLYLLQSAAGLLLFYGFYQLVLSRERSFRFNRFYLLGTPLLALLLPLVKIPVAVPEPVADTVWVYALPAAEAPALAETTVRVESLAQLPASPAPIPEAAGWGWPQTLQLLYLAGVLFFAYRLLRQLRFVRNLLQAHREQAFAWQECTVVPTLGSAPTFSFLRYIFFNDQPPLTEAEREQILQHERVHVIQHHSLDLLYLSILQILFWFNPLLPLYQKALADLHEFIADEEAVQGTTVESYAQLMVRQLFRDLNRPLLHSFASSRTLSRISMLHRANSGPGAWRQLLVVPVVGASVFFFSLQRYSNNPGTAPTGMILADAASAPTFELTSTPLNLREPHPDDEKIAYLVPKPSIQNIPSDTPYLKLPGAVSYADPPWDAEMAYFKGGSKAFRWFLVENVGYPLSAKKKRAEGLLLVSFVLHPDASLSEIKIEKNFIPELDVSVVEALKNSAGQWYPEDKGGVSKPEKLILPIWYLMDSAPVLPATTLPQGIYLKEHKIHGFYVSPPYYLGETKPTNGNQPSEKGTPASTEQDLSEFLKQHITYPAAALAAKAEGVEVLEFTVHVDGSLSNFNVLHSKHSALAQEVLRVIKATSGDWQPWVQNGKIVENKGRVQIRFRLEQQDAYLWNGYWF